VAVQAPVAVTPAIETVQARPAAIRRSTDGAPPSEEQRRALMLVVLCDLLRERPFGGFSR
jgi:hypothetical protein